MMFFFCALVWQWLCVGLAMAVCGPRHFFADQDWTARRFGTANPRNCLNGICRRVCTSAFADAVGCQVSLFALIFWAVLVAGQIHTFRRALAGRPRPAILPRWRARRAGPLSAMADSCGLAGRRRAGPPPWRDVSHEMYGS